MRQVEHLITRNPKVVIITPGSFTIPSPRSSSVETVIDKITKSLQEKVDFHVFGKKSKSLPSNQKVGNISYYRYYFKNWKYYLMKSISKIKEINPDIIQVENRPLYVLYLKKMFSNSKSKIWLSLHSTKFISSAAISISQLKKCIQITDKIIVNSQFLKDFLVRKTNCREEKVIVNHLGVDISQFKSKWHSSQLEAINEQKKRMGLENRNILLFVGRLKKMKGVHYILNILPELIKDNPKIFVVIIGSAFYGSTRKTGYVNRLEKRAQKFPNHIKFLPFISHDKIQNWYQLADLVYVPSNKNEAFGLVNLEAMACGVPVIASKAGGMKEIIEHGKTGYLIELSTIENGLLEYTKKILSSPEKQKKFGENCIHSIKSKYTWDHCAQRLYKLYLIG